MTTFKPGDTVRLSSGGPLMTVELVQPGNIDGNMSLVEVCWFSGKENDKLERDHFTSEVLVKIE